MKQITNLKKGDTIGIISTARKISEKELLPAIDKLEEWGLKVQLGKNLFNRYHQFAGTDSQRAEDLQNMLDDSKIKAVLCARGGYGTVKIIDKIDFSNFQKSPKWIIGYSDVTVLHSHIHWLGIETLHATMPINFPKNGQTNEAIDTLYKALFIGSLEYFIPPHKFNIMGKVKAPVVGGNLSILYSLLGSKSDISTEKKILFFEDLDEYLYHIDRMMMNMKRNNKFHKPAGVIIGGMSDMNDNQIPYGKTAKEIVSEIIGQVNYPVLFDFPAGHIADNRAMILGRKAQFEVTENGGIYIQ